MNYPVQLQQELIPARLIEQLVARHYLNACCVEYTHLMAGNDSEGIPDVFVFNEKTLIACIEVGAYVLSAIEDNQPARWVGNILVIDAEKSSAIHDTQQEPYTIVQKKLLGNRKYMRFDGADLILIIHSDVRLKDDRLMFAKKMNGVTSCNLAYQILKDDSFKPE